ATSTQTGRSSIAAPRSRSRARAISTHAEADRLIRLDVVRRIRLVTTNLILAEVHRLLLHRTGSRIAATMLDRIDSSPLVRIEFATVDHHRAARRWLERLADQRITYTDALSFAVMEALRCRIAISFDRDFVVAGFRLWQGRARAREGNPSSGI